MLKNLTNLKSVLTISKYLKILTVYLCFPFSERLIFSHINLLFTLTGVILEIEDSIYPIEIYKRALLIWATATAFDKTDFW